MLVRLLSFKFRETSGLPSFQHHYRRMDKLIPTILSHDAFLLHLVDLFVVFPFNVGFTSDPNHQHNARCTMLDANWIAQDGLEEGM